MGILGGVILCITIRIVDCISCTNIKSTTQKNKKTTKKIIQSNDNHFTNYILCIIFTIIKIFIYKIVILRSFLVKYNIKITQHTIKT